jgi:hypothetical protein
VTNKVGTSIQSITVLSTLLTILFIFMNRDRRGRDRMVVGFTTTYAISAYHH